MVPPSFKRLESEWPTHSHGGGHQIVSTNDQSRVTFRAFDCHWDDGSPALQGQIGQPSFCTLQAGMARAFGRHHQHLAGFKHRKRLAQRASIYFVTPDRDHAPKAREYPPTRNAGHVVARERDDVSWQYTQHHDGINKPYVVEDHNRRSGRREVVDVYGAAEPGHESITSLVNKPSEEITPALQPFVIVDQARFRCLETRACFRGIGVYFGHLTFQQPTKG